MSIKWDKEYSVDIKEIDEQHMAFFSLINKVNELLAKTSKKKELKMVLNELIDYAHFHFGTEEKYFDKFHYEEAKEHKDKHQEFFEMMKGFQRQLKIDAMATSFELIDYLEDWLVDHVNGYDKKYVKCFHDHGLF